MSKIPTAEEFLEDYKSLKLQQMRDNVKETKKPEEVLIEFAKLHLKAQSEAIIKKATVWSTPKEDRVAFDGPYTGVDEQSILNAYPLSNVK